ncbi:MAG: hypothetical protein Q7K48_09070 [Fusobacterium sp. JB021]|nr:hypothetical protein [Fusobacterium sp. JB020]MDP0494435.1 hypothetical protein [Fusobacterium sp. JB021]MDP0506787.1 hypothetical protein [Fusobacterium sp. JB019]
MKILIKNRKWNIFFETKVLVCDITEKNGIFNISFQYKDNNITIKSENIDNTLKYLDEVFKKEKKRAEESY